MKKITFLLCLFTVMAFGQEKYVFSPNFPDITINDFVKHADSLFIPSNQFAFNCNTNYMLPYDKIPKDAASQPGYEQEQLKLIEKDSLQPVLYGNLGLFYENKGETEKARQYYKKSLDKIGYIKHDKDSASMYSYKGYLKFHLGQDGVPDMEKAISINKKDSLSVYFYPMFLLTSQRFDDAKRILVTTLEDNHTKYYGYLMLYLAKVFESMGKAGETGDMAKALAKIDVEAFADMRPYNKYFKKSDEDFELMREMCELMPLTLKMMAGLDDKNYKPAAADLALATKKEAFFESRLKKKGANLFGLYMSLGTTSMAKRDYTASVDYFQKAIDAFPKDKEAIMFNCLETYNNIATIHGHFSKDYDKAVTVLKASLEVPVITDINRAITLADIGKLYYAKGDIDTAADYANQSVAVKETFEGDMFLGYVYVRQNLNSLGQRYIEKAQKLSTTLDNLSDLVNYYMILQIINGNFDIAVGMYEDNKEALAGNCKSCEYLIKCYLTKAK